MNTDMKITVNPGMEHLRQFVRQLPELFPASGEVLHDGRNQIRAFDIEGERLVVKRYKRPSAFNAVMYSFFRKSKARRAYEHALRLRELEIDTPEPVAWSEYRRNGLITETYLSRPEKGLQKRVNLMQQKTNSDLSRHYLPRQLRHLILQEYLSGVKTARQLSEEHGIPMSTIHKMGQRWKAKNSCSFVSTPNPYPIMSRVTSEEASELLSENKALRRRLEEALLRLEGYEIMGDILQEEYGIDLLKKSAAGQSSVSKKDTQQ